MTRNDCSFKPIQSTHLKTVGGLRRKLNGDDALRAASSPGTTRHTSPVALDVGKIKPPRAPPSIRHIKTADAVSPLILWLQSFLSVRTPCRAKGGGACLPRGHPPTPRPFFDWLPQEFKPFTCGAQSEEVKRWKEETAIVKI